MVTARRPKGSARAWAPQRRGSQSTWPPPPPREDKPWYVEEWSFGEVPPPQPTASGAGAAGRWLLVAGIIAIIVLAMIGVTFLLML